MLLECALSCLATLLSYATRSLLVVVCVLFEYCLPYIAGKSNLMDAFSFVLGDKITNMRASTLSVCSF